MKVLSFGGGVQTVALAAMSCLGKIEKPDFAVFADPGWESKGTYEYIAWFEGWMSRRGLRLINTAKGNIRADALNASKRFATMPLYTLGPNGEGMLRRQCTREYKIEPVQQAIRREAGLRPQQRMKQAVDLWLGISLDEALRMKPSRTPWMTNRWPIIDKRMSRGDCLRYLDKVGLPRPPKSACIGCPFHSNGYWSNLKRNSPEEWEDVCSFDEEIRHHRVAVKFPVFLHRSCVPLREANLGEDQLDMFNNECEGHCGL